MRSCWIRIKRITKQWDWCWCCRCLKYIVLCFVFVGSYSFPNFEQNKVHFMVWFNSNSTWDCCCCCFTNRINSGFMTKDNWVGNYTLHLKPFALEDLHKYNGSSGTNKYNSELRLYGNGSNFRLGLLAWRREKLTFQKVIYSAFPGFFTTILLQSFSDIIPPTFPNFRYTGHI